MKQTTKTIADEIRVIWPDYTPTRLVDYPRLAERCGVARVMAKQENERPLGNFKSLGGMYAGLWALARVSGCEGIGSLLASPPASLPMLICASDGNHGVAVAAAANRVGAKAQVYLHEKVPAVRANRIEALGAGIIWINGTYDDAVAAAAAKAGRDAILVPDTTDQMADPIVTKVMEGYGLIASEICDQIDRDAVDYPSHLFVQAGVGGLAAAMADGLSVPMGRGGHIVVVEPEAAPCVWQALRAGSPKMVPGPLQTTAEMLSCGLASRPALARLLRHEAMSVVVGEDVLAEAPDLLAWAGGPKTTASGAAGLAGLLHVSDDRQLKSMFQLCKESAVLIVVTEAAF